MRRLFGAGQIRAQLCPKITQGGRHLRRLQQADVVAAQGIEYRIDGGTTVDRLEHGTMDLIQPLVLEDEFGTTIEQSRFAVLALQALPFDRSRRNRIDLDFGADEAREIFHQGTLPRFRNGIVGAIGIRHGDVFSPPK